MGRLLAWPATLLAALSLLTLSQDPRLMPALVVIAAGLGLLGLGVRALGLLALAAHLVQLTGLGIGLAVAWTRSISRYGGSWLEQSAAGWAAAVNWMANSQAPMLAQDGVLILLLGLVGATGILVELLAFSCRAPLAAGLPLLILPTIPTVVLSDQLPWEAFLAAAAGWLILLAADTWRGDDPEGRGRRPEAEFSRSLWLRTIGIGSPVILAALLVGNLLAPLLPGTHWEGIGGVRSGPLQLQDPTLDLNENLRRPENVELIRYTTTLAGGAYLRSTSLPVVDAAGWHAETVTLLRGQPHSVPGVSDPEATVSTEISISELASPYLPAPYAPLSWSAPGQWSHDPVSLMIYNVGTDNSAATRGLRYTVRSTNPDPGYPALAVARAGVPENAASTSVVPQGVSPEVIQLTSQIVAGLDSDGARALAIQDWLRDPGRFTYSVQAPAGTGLDVLTTFLLRDREGYCIHFAASMALMARIIGIPSRVSIGFLPGVREGTTWVVGSHDLHAWPELFFADLGWVRFEPTVGVAGAPSWTTAPGSGEQEPDTEPSATPEQPSLSPTPQTELPQTPEQPDASGDQGAGGLNRWALLGGIAALLALLPGTARLAQRRHRLSGRGSEVDRAERAWQEVRASVIDLGGQWPPGTPRQIRDALAPGLAVQQADALQDVTMALERARYSSAPGGVAELADRVRQVRVGLRAGSSGAQRILAVLAPRSLWLLRD